MIYKNWDFTWRLPDCEEFVGVTYRRLFHYIIDYGLSFRANEKSYKMLLLCKTPHRSLREHDNISDFLVGYSSEFFK